MAPQQPILTRVRAPAVSFVRAQSLLENALLDRPDGAKAMTGSHVVLDGHGRILAVAPDVATRFEMTAQNLVGRRLVHRLIGPDRVYFARALLALRTRGAFEPLIVDIRQKQPPHLSARLELLLVLPAPEKNVVAICELRFQG